MSSATDSLKNTIVVVSGGGPAHPMRALRVRE